MKKLAVSIITVFLVVCGFFVFAVYKTGYSKDDRTTVTLKLLKLTLEQYRKECERFPTKLDELIQDRIENCPAHKDGKLIPGGRLPTDGWMNPLVYDSDGKNFRLSSIGHAKLEITSQSDVEVKSAHKGP